MVLQMVVYIDVVRVAGQCAIKNLLDKALTESGPMRVEFQRSYLDMFSIGNRRNNIVNHTFFQFYI